MRHCYVLRVFTAGDDGGNPLGVVTDTVGLAENVMQEIAADLAFSETVFIDWRSGGMPHVRIFTPATELPFAGHPMVGTAWILNSMGPGVESVTCGLGEVSFRQEDDTTWIVPPFSDAVEATSGAEVVAAKVGLANPRRTWLAMMPFPIRLWEYEHEEVVEAAAPDIEALSRMDESAGLYVFSRSDSQTRSRFFAPGLGIAEDPATGAAAVALAGVFRHEGEGAGAVQIHQGPGSGPRSELRLRWEADIVELGGSVRRDEVRILDR